MSENRIQGEYLSTVEEELEGPLLVDAESPKLAEQIRPKPNGSGRRAFVMPRSVAELPRAAKPELLDDKLPFRRRHWTNLRLQLIDHQHPVLLSEGDEFNEAVQRYWGLFRDQHHQEETSEVFKAQSKSAVKMRLESVGIRLVTERTRQDSRGSKGYNNELEFLLDSLPLEERELFDREYAVGKAIHINLSWGEKYKYVQFSDGSVKRFDYPTKLRLVKKSESDSDPDKKRSYRGSNYISFMKAELSRDKETGELRLATRLIAEVNVGTKTKGGNVRDPATKQLVGVKRDLESLKARHNEGDPLLQEPEFLYNQFTHLKDATAQEDKHWIMRSLMNFVKADLQHSKFKVKPNTSKFFLQIENGPEGPELMFNQDAIKENQFEDRAMRLNAKLGGKIARSLGEQAVATDKIRKRDKFVYFVENAYPSIQRLLLDKKVGMEGVCNQLVYREELRSKFIGASKVKEGDHLAYLTHMIWKDEDLGDVSPLGEHRARIFLDTLVAKNTSEGEPLVSGFTPEFVEMVLEKARKIFDSRYLLAANTTRKAMRIKVEALKNGANHKRGFELPNNGTEPILFEDQAVTTKGKVVRKAESRRHTAAFDLTPKIPSLRELNDELLEVGIEYFRLRSRMDGWKPRTYDLFLDDTKIIVRGTKWTGAEIMRSVRRNTIHKPGAYEAFCNRMLATVEQRMEKDPELMEKRDLYDYVLRNEATTAATGPSGAIGEIFLRTAIKYGLPDLLKLNGRRFNQVEAQVTYVDRDRQRAKDKLTNSERRLLNTKLRKIYEEQPEAKNRRPDCIVDMFDKATGESVELWFDSKSVSKKFTPVSIKTYHDIYKPYLHHGRILVIVANSGKDKIYKEAREMAQELGVILLDCSDIKKALTKVNHSRFNLEPGELALRYEQYSKHTTVYAENEEHVEQMLGVEDILDMDNIYPMFADRGTVPEKLGYIFEPTKRRAKPHQKFKAEKQGTESTSGSTDEEE